VQVKWSCCVITQHSRASHNKYIALPQTGDPLEPSIRLKQWVGADPQRPPQIGKNLKPPIFFECGSSEVTRPLELAASPSLLDTLDNFQIGRGALIGTAEIFVLRRRLLWPRTNTGNFHIWQMPAKVPYHRLKRCLVAQVGRTKVPQQRNPSQRRISLHLG
jgi:hypothetical protein